MAFLSISGTTVPVPPDGVEVEYNDVGDRARAWDGTFRTTVTQQKRTYRVRTVPMSSGTAASVVTALSCTPPVPVYGDMLPFVATAGYPELVSETMVSGGTGPRVVLEFRLHEGMMDTPGAWWRGSAGLYTSTGLTTQPTTEGTRIQGWVDRLGSYAMFQPDADAADQPLYALTAMGSTLPSIQLNARPWMFSTSSGLIANVDGTDKAWSLYAVVRIDAGVNSERYFWSIRNSTTNNGLHAVGVTLESGSTVNLVWKTLRRQDGSAVATERVSTALVTTGRNYRIAYRFDGTSLKMWANGTLVLSTSLDVGSATFNNTIIGAIDTAGNFQWSGYGGEFVWFPGIAFSADTRAAFDGLFAPYDT